MLSILVQPRCGRTGIAGIHDGMIKVKVASPPVDGQANDACIKYFSKLLRVPKKDVSIVKGLRAKRKRVRILSADINEITSILKPYIQCETTT